MCNYIFDNRGRSLRLSILKRLELYPLLLHEFKADAHPLVDGVLRGLLADVKKIELPEYAYTLVEREGRRMLGYHTSKGFDCETSYRGAARGQGRGEEGVVCFFVVFVLTNS